MILLKKIVCSLTILLLFLIQACATYKPPLKHEPYGLINIDEGTLMPLKTIDGKSVIGLGELFFGAATATLSLYLYTSPRNHSDYRVTPGQHILSTVYGDVYIDVDKGERLRIIPIYKCLDPPEYDYPTCFNGIYEFKILRERLK